jgi:hypothetical protein
MRPTLVRLIALLPFLAGCATETGARYVYQDGDFGVVGIPENTDRWPTRYRDQAEKLMQAHFPEGHEIIRAEEVVEGDRVVKVEGTNTAGLASDLPNPLLAAVKLGHTASRSRADSVKIKECRIIYRRAMRPVSPEVFAEQAGLTPTAYHDPNGPERRQAEACEPEGPGDEVAAGGHVDAAVETAGKPVEAE